MLTPLHVRLLQYAAGHNVSGLIQGDLQDDYYTATRELYFAGYLSIRYTPVTVYNVTQKGLDYLQALALREKWNAAVSGKGGLS